MIAHFAIGFLSGLFLGAAVFSNPLSRAVVMGLIAGLILGAIVVNGVDGYVRWATYLPVEMTKLSVFWIGMIAGFVSSAVFWPERRSL